MSESQALGPDLFLQKQVGQDRQCDAPIRQPNRARDERPAARLELVRMRRCGTGHCRMDRRHRRSIVMRQRLRAGDGSAARKMVSPPGISTGDPRWVANSQARMARMPAPIAINRRVSQSMS